MQKCLSNYVELIDSRNNWSVLSLIKTKDIGLSSETKLNFNELDLETIERVEGLRKVEESEEIEKLDNYDLIKLCLENKEEKVWEEFYLRFNQCIEYYVKKALFLYKNNSYVKEIEFVSLQEDLVQEIYVKLLANDYKALRSYKDKDKDKSFYSYLHKISVNTVVDYFRHLDKQKRQGVELSLEKANRELSKDFFSSKLNPCDLTILKCELEDILNKALSSTQSKRNKKIFILFTVLGMTSKEIIEVFDTPLTTDTIENVVKNIRKYLREFLAIESHYTN